MENTKQCGFNTYGSSEQCILAATDKIEIFISDNYSMFPNYTIHACKYHLDTWKIILGEKNLARLIGEGKIQYE